MIPAEYNKTSLTNNGILRKIYPSVRLSVRQKAMGWKHVTCEYNRTIM